MTRVSQPEFGHRLRERRKARGLSQRAVAGDLMAASYVSLVENGERVPTLDMVVNLADSVGVSVGELLGDPSWDVPGATPASPPVRDTPVAGRLEVRRLMEMGDIEGAMAVLIENGAALRPDDPHQDVELAIALTEVLAARGEHVERLRQLEGLLNHPSIRDSIELRLPLEIDQVSSLREVGRLAEARQAAHAALRRMEEASSSVTASERIRLLGVLTSVLCELDEFESVPSILHDMLTAARQLGRGGVLGRAHWVASMAYARMGEPALASEHLAHVRKGLPYASMSTADWLRFCRSSAAVMVDVGDLASAREWIEVAEATAGMLGAESDQVGIRVERARYELASGNAAAAAEVYATLTGEEGPLSGLDRVIALLGHAAALEAMGDRPAAIALLRRTAEYGERIGSYRHAAEAWRRLVHLQEAAAEPESL